MTKSIKAYAKINLHLDVTGKRGDGYHNVETVMQTVSLCDTVTVMLTEDGRFDCECNVSGVPNDEKNIAVRAAMMFAEQMGKREGVHIKIEKNIPMAAGLAGGSTDAAATLKAMNELYGRPLTEAHLCELGSRLGADVPFCIASGCAYSDGRGDILHEFPSIPDNTVFLVACGGEGVSTPWAYKLLDSVYNDFEDYTPRGASGLKAALVSDRPDSFSEHLFNVFEAPILAERPIAREIKERMLKGGARSAMMSGSGPSVFGIFACAQDAEWVEDEIKRAGYFAFTCRPIIK